MSDEQNGHGMSRLDRMEGLMQLLIDDHLKSTDEHNRLLKSQIVLTDRVDKLAQTTDKAIEQFARSQKDLAEAQKQLAEAQKHTDQRMDALIAVVDGIIRKPPTN
jgi:hypothetical protein